MRDRAAARGGAGQSNHAQDEAVRLLLLADTHVPNRAQDLPAQLWDEVVNADVVLHAGDWVAPELLDRLEARARRLVACWGNNDGPVLRSRLPERADVMLEGLHFTVVHETGAATGREARISRLYPDSDVVVFGHSHIPWDTTTGTGLRLLNPGSPTDRRRQPRCSYMTAAVDDNALTDVVLHFVET
jgi:putative phosphoesterase